MSKIHRYCKQPNPELLSTQRNSGAKVIIVQLLAVKNMNIWSLSTTQQNINVFKSMGPLLLTMKSYYFNGYNMFQLQHACGCCPVKAAFNCCNLRIAGCSHIHPFLQHGHSLSFLPKKRDYAAPKVLQSDFFICLKKVDL